MITIFRGIANDNETMSDATTDASNTTYSTVILVAHWLNVLVLFFSLIRIMIDLICSCKHKVTLASLAGILFVLSTTSMLCFFIGISCDPTF